MDKSTKDQIDLAELYGAMTLLKVFLDANKKNIKSNIPGSEMLNDWLTILYYEKMTESLAHHQKLMDSLKQKTERNTDGTFKSKLQKDICDEKIS